MKNDTSIYNSEILTGSLGDYNTPLLFDGAMTVLKPYIDLGQLVVKSGQTTREQCAIENWDRNKAKERMGDILATYYTNDKIDAVLSSSDVLSLGIEESLKSAGYNANNMPIITGLDADLPNVMAIPRGEQSMTVFKDTRQLSDAVVKMIDAIEKNKQPAEINNTTTYNNGVKVVPTYELKAILVDSDNYKEILFDSGYYSENEKE